MADNLIFHIGFDLEKAVNDAGQDWSKKYAKKLEDLMAKRPVRVRFDFEKLEDVKTRLAQLKIEPVTPETKSAIKELARELQTLAKALEAVQKYSAARGGATADAVRASKIQLNAEKARSQAALTAQRAARAEANLAQARLRDARAANVGTAATHAANKSYHEQAGYLQKLAQRMAAYWSVRQVGNFLTSVREVTAQFELQRVSLGAIIQDQNRANQLFGEIKAFALKSPVSILDLTKYTKQIAAYGVETEKLFDTTKMLTDVSVGLGTPLSQLALAFGQIRSSSVLRLAETRQLTEAGIPALELLAKQLEKTYGRFVSTAEVMELISKRAISFEMVEQMFKDMTSAGGMFYNMQEKQGNTIFGLWAKLGDAASVMYDEIGNTEEVNEGMKTAIGLLGELMRNWKAVADTVTWVVVPNAALLALYKYSTATQRVSAAQNAAAAATERRKAAVLRLSAAIKKGSVDDINAANTALQKAKADEVAAQKATTRMGLLKSGFASVAKSIGAGLGIGLAITAVTTLAYKLFEAYENAHRLDRKLEEISAETPALQAQSVRNFEFLAKAATSAADGSRQQKEALDELNRTYRDILPQDALKIENLRKMKGNYEELTVAIREYIAEQQKQKQLSAIEEEYGAREKELIGNIQKRMRKGFVQGGGNTALTTFVPGEMEISRFVTSFLAQATDATKSVKEKVVYAFKAAGIEASENMVKSFMADMSSWDAYWSLWGKQEGYLEQLDSVAGKHAAAIDGVHKATRDSLGDLGEYNSEMEQLQKLLHGTDKTAGLLATDTSTYQNRQYNANTTIKLYLGSLNASIKKKMGEGADIFRNGWVKWVSVLDEKDLGKITTAQMDKIVEAIDPGKYPDLRKKAEAIRGIYNEFVPSDRTVVILGDKLQQISNQFGVNMDITQQYLMKAGEDIETYAKRIKEGLGNAQKNLKELRFDKSEIEAGVGGLKPVSDKEIEDAENLTKVLTALFNLISGFAESGGGRGDGRVQTLEEINRALREMYERVEDAEKRLGHSKAVEFAGRVYKQRLEYLNELGREFGLKFGLPTTMKELSDYETEIFNALGKINTKDAKRALIRQGKLIDSDWVKNSMKEADRRLKELADRISRTKTAKEFYEKILEQTGDINIATRVSMSIYGSTGEELFNDTVEQIREAFKTGSEEHPIDLDISAAIDLKNQRIDYKKLADIYDKYQDDIIEKRRETAKKIATEGQKEIATDILNWRKSLAKAKSYEQKRTDIINTATAERAKIIRETTDPKERGELLGLSYSKQAQELAKLAVDEFKSSDDYIKVFQDLDRVSTQTLDRMKKRLEEMIATVKDTENVEGLKTLVEQLDKIKEERETRNPIEGIIDSFKEYAKARKDYRTAEAEEAAAKAEFAQQEVGLNMAIQTAKAEQAIAQQRVNDLKAQGKENTSEGVAAELVLNEATKKVTQATENRNKAVKKVNNAEQKTTDALDAQKAALAKLQKNVNAMANAFSSAASSIKTIADMMGIAEDSELGDIVNGLVDGLNNAATIMTTILAIAIAIEAACWWMLAIGAAVAAFSAIGSWLTGSKVRKANKEIERQQKLLDQLEYTYGRLEKAADKVFGREYVSNYSRQLEVLRAQQAAYLKQAEAERSKGKKKDKDKIKEYEEQARETADRIKELQNDLVAHFTGQSRTDAARQMAKSWIDAKASMSDTFAAIKGDYQDMIKNMLVEGAAARVIENALMPVWDSMEEMLAKNDVEGAIDALVNGMDAALTQANDGMEVLWKALEARGYDLKKLLGESDSEYTGIAKSVAGATSEEINANTAALNTQNYYMSHIDENVAAIRAMLSGGAAVSVPQSVATAAWTDWQQQAMDNYQAIARNTAETVLRCERAAVACEKMARAIKVKGSTSGFNVFLNNS